MSEAVAYATDGHVATITLDRPRARNAVDGEVARGLEAAVDRMEAAPEVRVAVLRANTEGHSRPVFCAGADLKTVAEGRLGDIHTERGGFAGFVFLERTKPVVAAVDGLATAGGLEIALACDIIVASEQSAFGLAEVTRNLVAAAGGLFRLPRAVGQAVAMDAILTGDPIPASRAYALGLVSRLVPAGEAYAEAIRVAQRIAANAPLAVRASREVVLATPTSDDVTLRSLSQRRLAEVMDSEDTQEGLSAFAEKRQPRWSGR